MFKCRRAVMAHRWLRIAAVLIVGGIALAGIVPAQTAQAQSNALTEITLTVTRHPTDKICAGDEVIFEIAAYLITRRKPGDLPAIVPLSGNKVAAHLLSGPGSITPFEQTIPAVGGMVVWFSYRSNEPGHVTISFESGILQGRPRRLIYTDEDVEFDVEDCAPKVQGVYRGEMSGGDGAIAMTAFLDEVKLELTGEGTYSGSTSFDFSMYYSRIAAGCSAAISSESSSATIDATEAEDRSLTFQVGFTPINPVASGQCNGESGSVGFQLDPGQLGVSSFTTPEDGGVVRLGAAVGEITYIVVRESAGEPTSQRIEPGSALAQLP